MEMNLKAHVYDIEVYRRLFLYMAFDPAERKWYTYEISDYRNQLDELAKYLIDGGHQYAVSFNGLTYDSQVLQFILDRRHLWVDLDNASICQLIKKFSDRTIDDTNYGLFPPYREEDLEIRQIDLFRIHHFDNVNRRTSLKWLQFSMDAASVEETPIPWEKEYLTEQEIAEIREYCQNDIITTCQFWNFTIGNTTHELYKGRNKVQDRLDLIEEMEFPLKAINWSDVKLGDEINKKVYMQLSGISDPRKLIDMKLNAKRKRGFTYGDCIPQYVQFKTKPFQDFLNRMRKVRVNLNEEEEYPFIYNGTRYTIAKGGIHSSEGARIIEVREGEICMDADVGSQYPHSIIKRGLYPSHLGKAWLVGYTQTRDKRLAYKSKLKNYDKGSPEYEKYKGLSETFKLALNGGGFGKTNDRENWQYAPFVHFSCTIGNQFEILMLIEALEVEGIHVISANTDGIVCLFDRSRLDKYYEICQQWEKIVGNTEQGQLEFAEYVKIIQSSVNDYLAIKADGSVKKKGDFSTEFELNKNKSRRIIPIALENYFVKNIPVEETITKHRKIFDFCVGVKASKNYHYELVDREGKIQPYHRMVRYYVSKEGKLLLKIKNPEAETDGNEVTRCEAGGWKCTVANEVDTGDDIKAYKIDYDYYVQKAEEKIRDIMRGRKGKKLIIDKNQTSLF
jgi:hypothetical protein